MDITSLIAEQHDISRMCLKLAHNFIRNQEGIKSNNNDTNDKKLEGCKKHEKQNLERTNKEELINNNDNIPINIDRERLELFDYSEQQDDRELFQELNLQFQNDSFKETENNSNEDQNIQLYLEFQVEPGYQDDNGKEQQMPERGVKLDLKIVFESEEEEKDHKKNYVENTQVQLDKDTFFRKQTRAKYCSDNRKEDIELEPTNKKLKLMEKQHCENVKDIDRFEISGKKEQKLIEETNVKLTKSNEESQKKIEKKLKESNIDLEKMMQGNFDSCKFLIVNEKIFKNMCVSLEKYITLLEDRVINIQGSYFLVNNKLYKECNDKVQTDPEVHKNGNKIIQKTLNDETQLISQDIDNKIKCTVNGDKTKLFKKDKNSEFHDDKIVNGNNQLLLNLNEKVNKISGETKTHFEIKEKIQEKSKEIVETEEPFDLVLLYNNDLNNINEKTQHSVNVQQINYNEEIITEFEKNYQQNDHNVDHLKQNIVKKTIFEPKELKLQFSKKQNLQFYFFKEEECTSLASLAGDSNSETKEYSSESLKSDLFNKELKKLNESGCIQEFSQEDTAMNVKTFSDTVNNSERKIQNEYKVDIEMFEEETLVSSVNSSICINVENSNELLKCELYRNEQIKLNESDCIQEIPQEDSDVDIETFSDTIDGAERETLTETDHVEMFVDESELKSYNSFDEEDYCNNFNKCMEINEVTELVEEYDVVTESIIKIKKQTKIEDLNRKAKNTPQLDGIQKGQITQALNSQSNTLNENIESKYNRERNLTNNKSLSNYPIENELQRKLSELNFNFQNTIQEFNCVAQQKLSSKHLQKRNEKKSTEIINLLQQLDEMELTDENLSEKLKEHQKDYYELQSEFQHSIQFEDSHLNLPSKEEPYDIFEKLYTIHNKKLHQFAQATKWPENCLYPSSLLDSLFEDPDEENPNVLLFTLYSEDIGYSIKIDFKQDELPTELIFSYSSDNILRYVEEQKLHPDLLRLLNLGKSRLFYSGCIIAEIHDLINGAPGRISRILLRPCYESLTYDMNKIIEDNPQIHWTYHKILYLESILLLKLHPVICEDILPVAGTTVLMQYQLLSGRSICLNPLTNDINTLKTESLNTSLFNENKSSNSMDFARDKYSILWEFGFRLKSSKNDILNLTILDNTDSSNVSLLISSSDNVKPVTIMKIETQFGLDNGSCKQLIDLITLSLDILRQKISNDIEVFHIHKNDKYPFHTLKFSSTLPDENINEVTYANISKLIEKFMVNVSINHLTVKNYLENVLDSEIDPLHLKLVVNPEILTDDPQNTSETHLNLQMDHKIKKSIHLCPIKKLSNRPSKYLDVNNVNVESYQIVKSPEYSSKNTEKKSDVDLSFSNLFPLNNTKSNLAQIKFEVTPIPHLISVIPPIPCYLTLVSTTTSTMSSFETSTTDSSMPNNLQFLTNEQTLSTDNTRLESAIASPSEHLEHLITVRNSTACVLGDEQSPQITSNDHLETEFSQINEETVQEMSCLLLD